MTFISTVIAKQGIILSADSKELVQGGQLMWKDFDDILKSKNTTEDDTTESISPIEIKEKFKENALLTKGRVKSTDGAKKIFQIGSHSAILLSGVANPSGQDFSTIIQTIRDAVQTSLDTSITNILNITYLTIESLIIADTSDDKYQSEYLFCGMDELDNKFKVFRFCFQDKFKMDASGNIEKDANGQIIREKYFSKYERNVLLNTSGWTNYVGELGTINQVNLAIELPQAFDLSKKIMDLVVTIENISNEITGIGGRIYYAAISKDGFFWVDSEAEVMNLIR
jgi:hypothetical protein